MVNPRHRHHRPKHRLHPTPHPQQQQQPHHHHQRPPTENGSPHENTSNDNSSPGDGSPGDGGSDDETTDDRSSDGAGDDNTTGDDSSAAQLARTAASRFDDVNVGDYYATPVGWMLLHNITSGCTTNRYCADTPITRQDFVTFLWRAAGRPTPAQPGSATFTDVTPGHYTDAAIDWAQQQNITTGCRTNNNRRLFCPNEQVTRGQTAVLTRRQRRGRTPCGDADGAGRAVRDDHRRNPATWCSTCTPGLARRSWPLATWVAAGLASDGNVEWYNMRIGYRILGGGAMRISERGQITIPRRLREQCGFNHKVEVELTPTDRGLLIHKRTSARHPVDTVFGIIEQNESTDSYIEELRGR